VADLDPMIDATGNCLRNLEHDLTCAVRKTQRSPYTVPHNDMVKERLFHHPTETDCECGEAELLFKLYGISMPCSYRCPLGSQVQKPECPEQPELTFEEDTDLWGQFGQRLMD
jgi:hypothetical protein